MASVTYDHVTKKFGESTILNNLSVHIEDKEIFVFWGPSASGKTTALRCLLGLEDVTSGRILVDGRDVTKLPPKDRNVACLGADHFLYPHMTVYEYLAFGLELRKLPEAEITKRVEKAVEVMGLSEILDCKRAQLSDIQCQLVAMGRAVARESSVFVFDDLPLKQVEILTKIHQQSQMTFIYATSIPEVAMALGTRIAILKEGELQQVDTSQNLLNKPRNAFEENLIRGSFG